MDGRPGEGVVVFLSKQLMFFCCVGWDMLLDLLLVLLHCCLLNGLGVCI